MRFNIPCRNNKKLATVVKAIEANKELQTYWKCANVNAIDRLGYSDHGSVHVKIVANIALKILRMLIEAGVKPSIVTNHKLTNEDAEVVVVLASILHDVGMIVHREGHDEFGLFIAFYLLHDLLKSYSIEERSIIISEVLHAMVLHDSRIKPLTIEAGVVRVADALDMEKGRARIPFTLGKKDIHAVSALAIDEVIIKKGKKKPILIKIVMNNSAGIFQIDNLLKPRIEDSGLQKYITVVAEVKPKERKILK